MRGTLRHQRLSCASLDILTEETPLKGIRMEFWGSNKANIPNDPILRMPKSMLPLFYTYTSENIEVYKVLKFSYSIINDNTTSLKEDNPKFYSI